MAPFDGKNLQKTPTYFVQAVTVSDKFKFKIVDIQKLVKITKWNFRNDTIRYQKSIKDSHTSLN